MGEIIEDGNVPSVVDSMPVFRRQMESDKHQTEFDKTLAALIYMGYELDVASNAILECGILDVTAVIDYMDNIGGDIPSGAMSSTALSRLAEAALDPTPSMALVVSVGSPSKASSSRCNDEVLPTGYCKQLPSAAFETKGKEETLRAFEKGWTARWAEDDGPVTDNKSYLLEMGFCEKQVFDALQFLGESADVNDLTDHIMKITLDPVSTKNSGDDNSETDTDDLGLPPSKGDETKLEPTELERRIISKMDSMRCSVSVRKVSNAVKACGNEASEAEIVDYLFRADEKEQRGEKLDDEGVEWHNQDILQQLQVLGYSHVACLRATENNPGAGLSELLDYFDAEKYADKLNEEEEEEEEMAGLKRLPPSEKIFAAKRRRVMSSKSTQVKEKKGKEKIQKYEVNEEGDLVPIFHRNMTGFGLPGQPVRTRQLRPEIEGVPYFYFENVANTPNGEWENISRHLYDIKPELVDSLNFSCCRRPRGYIHNLPIHGRKELQPRPPMTIPELFPHYAKYWPSWDSRVKFNTITTRMASEFVKRKLQAAGELDNPSPQTRKDVMFWAKQCNLVWIFHGILAPLAADEVERLLGFDAGHTRQVFSLGERVKALGNSFQINTVAFHLSVLKPLFPDGIRVLSLFSGIGGAEVALHKLGIHLKVVVSVEIEARSRAIMNTWWESTDQKGKLIDTIHDVRKLDSKTIRGFVRDFGGFDLVIGGSPCNNLSGNNRCTRVGLQGSESITFFEFPRILTEVKECMKFFRDNYWI